MPYCCRHTGGNHKEKYFIPGKGSLRFDKIINKQTEKKKGNIPKSIFFNISEGSVAVDHDKTCYGV